MTRITKLLYLGAALGLVGCAVGNNREAHAAEAAGGCKMAPTASKSGSWTIGMQGYHAELWSEGSDGRFVVCIVNQALHTEIARASVTIADDENFATQFCTKDGVDDPGIFSLGKPGEAGAFAPRIAWRFDGESQSLKELDANSVRCIYSD
jgi:hypothetical protein